MDRTDNGLDVSIRIGEGEFAIIEVCSSDVLHDDYTNDQSSRGMGEYSRLPADRAIVVSREKKYEVERIGIKSIQLAAIVALSVNDRVLYSFSRTNT